MTKYEYRAVDIEVETLAQLEERLNAYGQQGWELVEGHTTFGKMETVDAPNGMKAVRHVDCVQGFYLFKREDVREMRRRMEMMEKAPFLSTSLGVSSCST